MKKLTALFLALTVALSLCACSVSDPAGSEAPSQAPAESAAISEEPSQAPAEPAGSITDFYEATVAKYEFPPMVLAEGDMLEMFYPGLSALSGVEEFEVYTPMMTGSPSELTVVKLAEGGDPDSVKAIFDARVEACTKEGENYPETIDSWLNNCRQVVSGRYLLLVVHTDCDAIAADFEAAFPA